MATIIRSYQHTDGDHMRVLRFLTRINHGHVTTPHYLWGRWAWQFGPYMNMAHLSHIGIAEDNENMVGLVTYEGDLGEAYICVDPAYAHLKPDLIAYAAQHLHDASGSIRITLPNGDLGYQQAAVQQGFVASQDSCTDARIDIAGLSYTLPDGYHIMTFNDPAFDADQYYEAIWKGFDNKRPRNALELESMLKREEFSAPHYDPSLRVLVVAPNGDYASHCGMWHLAGDPYAYVEPVFTLPEYRRMGLGKAAVLEGLIRCGKRGAQFAFVGSSQQFYYSIGFYPFQNETWWTKTV